MNNHGRILDKNSQAFDLAMELPSRYFNRVTEIFAQAKIYTVEQVLTIYDDREGNYHGNDHYLYQFGSGCMKEIDKILEEYGLVRDCVKREREGLNLYESMLILAKRKQNG